MPATTNGRYLMGLAEVSEYIEKPRSWIAGAKDFPQPIVRLRCGPIWNEQDVIDWEEKQFRTKLLASPALQRRHPNYPREDQ